MTLCRHCNRRNAHRPRGLCITCYRDLAVRNLYPPNPKYADRGEPTEAELNQMIAEQMQCLPDWWDAETKREAEENASPVELVEELTMAENSGIEWTTHTFNPWRGCTKVSPGCKNCYAETMSGRNPKTLGVWGPQGTRVVASEAQWKLPVKWNAEAARVGERHRVFCASLADVFEGPETMPADAWPKVRAARVRLFHLISETPHLDWLLLTKRPENVNRFCVEERSWSESPPPNIWLGTSVENQATADERIPHLLETPAAIKFLSCEPLLAPIDFKKVPGFNRVNLNLSNWWVIVGGESGPGARPMELSWARSLVRQCQVAKVPVFVKQLGAAASDPVNGIAGAALEVPAEAAPLVSLRLKDKKGGEPSEWPEDLRVREFPTVPT